MRNEKWADWKWDCHHYLMVTAVRWAVILQPWYVALVRNQREWHVAAPPAHEAGLAFEAPRRVVLSASPCSAAVLPDGWSC